MKPKKIRFFTLERWHLGLICVCFTVLSVFLMTQAYGRAVSTEGEALQPGRIAIVIDDFGRQRKGVKEMLELDVKLTAAVIPFLEYSAEDATYAAEHGKEVILHLPMQATTHDIPSHIGTRTIKVGQSAEEIRALLSDAKAELPQAVGANIHMGTLACSKREVMEPIMAFMKENQMFFLDSMTSRKSVCKEVAGEVGVDFLQNRVFLEHEEKSKAYVKKELEKAIKIAQKTGSCIVIGHVGYEGGMITVNGIREMQDAFQKNNIELVYVSELVTDSHYTDNASPQTQQNAEQT